MNFEIKFETEEEKVIFEILKKHFESAEPSFFNKRRKIIKDTLGKEYKPNEIIIKDYIRKGFVQIKEGSITYPSYRTVYAIELISSISAKHWTEHVSNIYFREMFSSQLKVTSSLFSKSQNEAIELKNKEIQEDLKTLGFS